MNKSFSHPAVCITQGLMSPKWLISTLILAALAAEFGVSERFATVRVSLYGLIKGGR